MFAVIAAYRAHPGQSDRVAAILAQHMTPTREEPGCLAFTVNRCEADPDRFILYEQYVDDAAFRAHRQTKHFREYIEGEVAPLLSEREWQRYTVIDPSR